MAVPSPLYHVTSREQLAAIQQYGIEPRAGEWPVVRHTWTAPRVFFNTTLMGATEMAMMFNHERRHGSRDFVILLVDPHQIPRASFRPDAQSDGVWTRAHVPPAAITGVEEPDWESDEFSAYMDGEEDEDA